MNDTIIAVQNLYKLYRLYNKPSDRLKEVINPFGRNYHKEFYALRNVSFDVGKGEMVGVVGKNGSGKSTLLKILTGVLSPTSGQVDIKGKVSALLELGTGFNPEYSGVENIYFSGTLIGYSREQMKSKITDIISFADIGDYILQPVKTYSSGMFVRLAFAVAINVDPEILIIDEALSVGDIRFQQKCFRKIEEFRKDKTVLFVSHDLTTLTRFCNRIIWFNDGAIVDDGDPETVLKQYQAYMLDSQISKYQVALTSACAHEFENELNIVDESLDVLGDNKAQIMGVGLFDLQNRKTSLVAPQQKVNLIIKVKFNSQLENPIVGFSIKDRLNNIIAQSNSYVLGNYLESSDSNLASFLFEFTIPSLNSGFYTISPAIASGSQDNHIQHNWIHDALIFQVMNKQKFELQGLLTLEDVKFYHLNQGA